MDFINGILELLNDYLYSYILLALLVGGGIYFTFRSRFVQLRLLGTAIKEVGEKTTDDKNISSFQVLMVSTASKVGTGNIVGVAGSIAAGGPGAVFWMWIIALLGGATSFVENTLAQIYKIKSGDETVGGPSAYLEHGLKKGGIGKLYSILFILTFFYAFNSLAAFNVTSSFEYYFPEMQMPVLIAIGAVLAVGTALAIFGGAKQIGAVSAAVVPIMSVVYIALALVAMIMNIGKLPAVIGLIVREAFNFKAIFGGFFGSCIVMGLKRGLYSNEAGMGSSPYAAASAETSHPVKVGLTQFLSIFLDTILICSATAFMLLLSDVGVGELSGMPYVQAALKSLFGEFGVVFITIAIILFGYTTIIGNYFYAEANIKMLTGNESSVKVFRIIQIIVVFVGPFLSFSLAWNLGDFFMGLLTIVNMIAIFALGRVAFNALADYEKQKREGKNPVFKESNIGLTDTQCWKG